MKKISVIVPVYNVELYLDTCINSIIKQKHSDLEVILIDDGSKDKSGQICDEFAKIDSRIRVIHTENRGLSAARNEGIRNSLGEYIMFVDSDDFITQNSIKDILNIITEQENIDIITGKVIKYYDSQKQIKPKFKFEINKFNGKSGIEVLTYFFDEIPATMWPAWLSIYRRELLINNNLYFTEGITSEDLDLIPRVYMHADKVVPYDVPFYYYRQLRPNSIVNTVNSKRFYDIVFIIEKYVRILQENKYSNEFKKSFLKQLANIYSRYVAILGYLPKYERDIVINEMKKIENILVYTQGLRGKYIAYSTKYFGFKVSYSVYKFIKEISLDISRFKQYKIDIKKTSKV